jgi:hypothetical protein
MITVEMEFERETKNQVRFAEIGAEENGARLGTLYVPKSTLAAEGLRTGVGTPARITVEIKGAS